MDTNSKSSTYEKRLSEIRPHVLMDSSWWGVVSETWPQKKLKFALAFPLLQEKCPNSKKVGPCKTAKTIIYQIREKITKERN